MNDEAIDLVNRPPHYRARGVQCDHCGGDIECRNVNRYFKGNLSAAIKYIWRCDFKDDEIQDLEKAVNYLNDEIAWRKKKIQDAELVEAVLAEIPAPPVPPKASKRPWQLNHPVPAPTSKDWAGVAKELTKAGPLQKDITLKIDPENTVTFHAAPTDTHGSECT